MYVSMYVCMYVCVYIYIYIYMYVWEARKPRSPVHVSIPRSAEPVRGSRSRHPRVGELRFQVSDRTRSNKDFVISPPLTADTGNLISYPTIKTRKHLIRRRLRDRIHS